MQNRQQIIDALKQFQAGEITKDQLPKPQPEAYCWHYDGSLYRRINHDDHKPHPSNLMFEEEKLCEFALAHYEQSHIVYDTSGGIAVGDLQPEQVGDDEMANALGRQAIIIRIGATLPLGYLIPVKASKMKEFGLL